jgi:hypothetical protein
MIKLWLDDLRRKPIGFTHWAKTADEAIAFLATGEVEHISLDHDLQEEHYQTIEGYCSPPQVIGTGYAVALWIEEAVRGGTIKMPTWACHSMNPSGKARIEAAMRSAERYATNG